ncbi:unnamed protein product [Mytilus coruscus]|uniref:Uncharacterized protein n=1 Tax=Mytilus coruscus TaxID=42192 RepID=A0A6J8AHH9_MYTCO|nr:unnamed protein product [Mytilus coruscus]
MYKATPNCASFSELYSYSKLYPTPNCTKLLQTTATQNCTRLLQTVLGYHKTVLCYNKLYQGTQNCLLKTVLGYFKLYSNSNSTRLLQTVQGYPNCTRLPKSVQGYSKLLLRLLKLAKDTSNCTRLPKLYKATLNCAKDISNCTRLLQTEQGYSKLYKAKTIPFCSMCSAYLTKFIKCHWLHVADCKVISNYVNVLS